MITHTVLLVEDGTKIQISKVTVITTDLPLNFYLIVSYV